MKKSKFNWKPGAIALVILGGILLGCTIYIKSQKKFEIVHNAATPSTVGADGRAAVGAAESYTVSISPALAWAKTKGPNKDWRNVAMVFMILTCVYVAMGANDVFSFKGDLLPVAVGIVVTLAGYFAAYSSAFSNNSVTITPEQYEYVQGDQQRLEELFNKDYIR